LKVGGLVMTNPRIETRPVIGLAERLETVASKPVRSRNVRVNQNGNNTIQASETTAPATTNRNNSRTPQPPRRPLSAGRLPSDPVIPQNSP
jgi:hypothetical protein